MALQYRVAPLPQPWPGEPTGRRKVSPFKVNWTSTLRLLETELKALHAQDVVLRLAVTDTQIRNDGGVRADARIKDPSVVLEFKSGADRLSFPCDRFNWWEDNVRAIALALEALRKVDRYGVRSGRQYEGFKALPGGNHAPAVKTVTIEAVAERLEQLCRGAVTAFYIKLDVSAARDAVRRAALNTHPDSATGSTAAFQELQQIKHALSKYHGVTL
ncbi:MAG: molecular chaperone DnaJ [Gemmatimonas sp.]|nr:molecular chaperone DnaJ [Gemmatimonas sp.]